MATVSKQEREFGQSSHPTTHQVPGDLSGPGAGKADRPHTKEKAMNHADDSESNGIIDSATDSKARELRIAELAYGRAEGRGFAPGYELDDWLAAEKEMAHAPSESSPSDSVDPLTPNLSKRPTPKSMDDKTSV
jgi:hypothetical protein